MGKVHENDQNHKSINNHNDDNDDDDDDAYNKN